MYGNFVLATKDASNYTKPSTSCPPGVGQLFVLAKLWRAGSVCSCKSLVDLTLVLDSSSTVRDWPAIREFAVSILDFFDIGSSRARVAVVVVGRTSSVVVRLDQYSDDRQRLYSAIRDLSQAGGPRSVLKKYTHLVGMSIQLKIYKSQFTIYTLF